ncbi:MULTISPECIES: FecCD family ABC transporter permease [Staphylococcus]|uniref:FecCD family ABC transporter permease n=1 Tax=Staphylococcus TaxID=1279 RepID=UPI000246363F|nr:MULTISPECIES: iron ABC transporter permease [Staphylococcus]QAV31115.1 iron ABC transporter permease [Sulfitobacter donghicola]AGZ25995.1 iron chelate uptake ABC transporter, FeCT family, permease protein [Staphylococcus pasteuri SP1]MBN6853665.1 iron ABC transporter permease [Staphylococcus warneri]MBT2768712.1 iron ABC transporter permease [Staphylococcus warneri]MBX7841373.1 iron ABC transporter permease [Staphylococcus warneri]
MKKIKVILIWTLILIVTILMSLMWQIGDLSDPFNQTILLKVRLPRLLEALLAGATLTLAGQMFQTVLNNPLADSFTLGLASGATFGSGLALFLGLSFLWIPFFSIGFSLITLIIVLSLTMALSTGYPVRVLILLGLMIGALFNALLYILILIKPQKLNTVANYLFGGFASAEVENVIMIAIVLAFAVMGLGLLLRPIKLLQLGELKGQSLGLNVQRMTFMVLTIASIMTAVVVAYVGIIGFIGMIVPQLIRRYYWRFELGMQMVLNIIIGAIVMALADFIGSVVIHPIQVPASIIMSLLGIPVLCYILLSQSKILR